MILRGRASARLQLLEVLMTDSFNKSMSPEGVCRTAPATPGLLIISQENTNVTGPTSRVAPLMTDSPLANSTTLLKDTPYILVNLFLGDMDNFSSI